MKTAVLQKSAPSIMEDEEDDLLSSPFSRKPVAHTMIENVLSVYPDVDPIDIAKDLEITRSPVKTVNRILDGQFPAVITIDVDDESKAKDHTRANLVNIRNFEKSEPSVDKANVLEIKDDSSDIDADSNDDDIIVAIEERKSLFSALRSRLNEKESRKCPQKGSKALESSVSAQVTSYHVKGKATGRKTMVKCRSSIIDLSFSDDNEQEDIQDVFTLHSPAAKTLTTNSSNQMPPKENRKAAEEYFKRSGEIFVDCSQSHDYSSDSDDLPCVLPSLHTDNRGTLSSKSHSNSCTDDYKSRDSQFLGSNFDSQDDSQIPVKKKKGSPHKITRERNEAHLKKQVKKLEKQTKKEAKEKEQHARKQAREQLKIQKDRDKLLKMADRMNQKSNNRLDGCIKQIVVCIDHEIVSCCQLAGENLLLQRLETLEAGHEIKSQLFPSSITWQRACVQHDVQEGTLQISMRTTVTDENHAVLCLSVVKFVEMVLRSCEEIQNPAVSVIADEETLTEFFERALTIYPGKTITLIVMGLEKYFRDVKLAQKHQFRKAVLGKSSSDNDNSSSKRRKKINKESVPSVMVSRVDVEEVLVDLQIKQPDCRIRMCETEEEFADLLAMLTKAVAEAPFKKKQPEVFSFCVEGQKRSVKVSKDGEGLKKVWQKHFQQLRNVSAEMAAAITNVYPSPQSLIKAYQGCSSREEASKLLQDILVRRGAGVLASSRRIGPELSRRVYLLFSTDDGDLSLK